MKLKNINLLLAIGQVCLSIGFLSFIINYIILENNQFIAFFSGMLFGLSLVLNLTYLIRIRKEK
jgi:hypothetical protein